MPDNTTALQSDRNLALEAVRVTEAAALAASRQMGRGDEKTADQAAVDAMRRALNGLAIRGKVVIGEGERDEAPMLYIGEKVGMPRWPAHRHRPRPAGGHHHHRQGRARTRWRSSRMAEAGNFLHSPDDTYMQTRSPSAAVCPTTWSTWTRTPLDETLKNCWPRPSNMDVSRTSLACILDRPRHERPDHRQGARGRRAHHADRRTATSPASWRPALPNSGVDIYHGHRRRPRGRAGVPPRCAASAASSRAAWCSATTTSAARADAPAASPTYDRKYTLDRTGGRRRDVRRHRGHRRLDAARRAPLLTAAPRPTRMVMRSKSGTVR